MVSKVIDVLACGLVHGEQRSDLQRRQDAPLVQKVPVDTVEEGVPLDLLGAFLAAAEPLIDVNDEQLFDEVARVRVEVRSEVRPILEDLLEDRVIRVLHEGRIAEHTL